LELDRNYAKNFESLTKSKPMMVIERDLAELRTRPSLEQVQEQVSALKQRARQAAERRKQSFETSMRVKVTNAFEIGNLDRPLQPPPTHSERLRRIAAAVRITDPSATEADQEAAIAEAKAADSLFELNIKRSILNHPSGQLLRLMTDSSKTKRLPPIRQVLRRVIRKLDKLEGISTGGEPEISEGEDEDEELATPADGATVPAVDLEAIADLPIMDVADGQNQFDEMQEDLMALGEEIVGTAEDMDDVYAQEMAAGDKADGSSGAEDEESGTGDAAAEAEGVDDIDEDVDMAGNDDIEGESEDQSMEGDDDASDEDVGDVSPSGNVDDEEGRSTEDSAYGSEEQENESEDSEDDGARADEEEDVSAGDDSSKVSTV
jgi:hypothetical protein